ncbi:MAG: hypothetical protein Tsb009_14740 [Planctomycetaceae bacterium]
MSREQSERRPRKKSSGRKKKGGGNAAVKIGVRVGVVLILGTLIVLALLDQQAKAKAVNTGNAWTDLLKSKSDNFQNVLLKDLEPLIEGDPQIRDGKDVPKDDQRMKLARHQETLAEKYYRWSFMFQSDHVIRVTYVKGTNIVVDIKVN